MPVTMDTLTFSLLFLPILASDMMAAPPRQRESGNEAWEASVGSGEDEHLSVYCFLPDGVMVEIQKFPGRDGTVSAAFYEHTGEQLTIRWTRLRNQKLFHTSTEVGQLKKIADGVLSYRISDHTDQRQIGDTFEFRRVTIDDETYGRLLQLGSLFHQLKLKELDQQRLVDHYNEQIQQYENAIQRLLR